MRIRPTLTPSLLLLLTACAGAEPGPPLESLLEAEAESARLAALVSLEGALAEAVQRVEQAADGFDRILSPLPVMTPGEEAALRSYLNASHVARARMLGVQAADRNAVDSLMEEGRLIQLADSTQHWIVRPRTSPAYVVPHTRELLAELGARFQEKLAERGLPPYRLEVTSALRTSERQEALRRSNPNAAAGDSSHEFGTTVDISYAAFAPPSEISRELLGDVPVGIGPFLERFAALAFESVSARKSRELTAILGQVLREAQAEGLVLVIYERQQTVFHLTVGRALAEE